MAFITIFRSNVYRTIMNMKQTAAKFKTSNVYSFMIVDNDPVHRKYSTMLNRNRIMKATSNGTIGPRKML